jgi:ABC-type amino acid transport substrate-binding protein
MLQKQRGDAFPRAVFEAYGDAIRQREQFAVESELVLVYPSAVYFFVHRDNQRLASAIERGLRQLIASGRFDLLFQQRYGAAIVLANLGKRRQIRLGNPLAPLNFPLSDSPLWFQPVAAAPAD